MPDRTHDSATFGDSDARMRRGAEEEECHWNMETLNIVQEEGITSAYEQQHTRKLQPKPRFLDTVTEEPESDDSECMVDVESRNDESNTNTTLYRDLQEEEEETNIPLVPRETVHGGCEEEHHHVVSTNTKNRVLGEEKTRSGGENKKGKSKRVRKRKTTSEEEEEEEPNSEEAPERMKKKFKHSSRRQRNRTLEKELLETPDDEIRSLPIKDMLRLVDYRDWLEKKEAKGAPALPPAQESNANASEDNHYYSQGFDAEDELCLEEWGNQENNVVVKPDSPVNYQTYMNKTPRTRWSKQDTQRFYEVIRELGSDLSMVQQLLFPKRKRQQIKLKFKSEEGKFPLKLNEALSTRYTACSLP